MLSGRPWNLVSDPVTSATRVYAGLSRLEWPWIVLRLIAETTATSLVTSDDGGFWQVVVSEGTLDANGPD